MKNNKGSYIDILLVEDNPNDIKLTKLAFNEFKIFNKLNILRNGEEALRYLKKQGDYKDSIRPDIILLDLFLPGKHGLEVLKEIKTDPELEDIPVVILSSSEDEEDIEEAYANFASCYVSKPLDFKQFVEIIKSLSDFWLSIVALPGKQ